MRSRHPRTLDVVDTVEAAAGTPVPVRLAFNLHPDVACDLRAGHAELSWQEKQGRRQRAVLTLPQSLRWTVHRGETNPILGWYSESFGNKEPAPLLLGTGCVAPNQPFSSRLAFGPADSVVALAPGESLANADAAR